MGVPEESAADAVKAENDTIFRETNDAIRAVVASSPNVLPIVPFVCECDDPTCRVLVRLSLDDYARMRDSPRRFLMAQGHEERSGKGMVVERVGEAVIFEKRNG